MRNRLFPILISIALFSFGSWLFYKYLFDNGFGFFNLLVNGNSSELISTRSGELIAGDKVFGRFQNPYPNLGIVSVRFDNQNRDSDDTLIFRLKEVDAPDWYYQAEYKTDQFLPKRQFPFGFPQIKDSNGRVYQFEIESLRGATGSGIFLDSTKPVFSAASFFDRKEILSDQLQAIKFVGRKLANVVNSQENLIRVGVFFSPFFFYLLYLFFDGASFHFLTLSVLAVVYSEIFYLSSGHEFLIFSTLSFWVFVIKRHRFEPKISGVVSFMLVLLAPLFIVFGYHLYAEKMAIWSYLFLSIAIFQQAIEMKMEPRSHLTLEVLWRNLFQVRLDTSKASYRVLETLFLPVTVLVALLLIIQSFQRVTYSLELFQEFFYQNPTSSNKNTYLALIALTTIVSIITFIRSRHLMRQYPILILVFFFVVKSIVSGISAHETAFQYTPTIFTISPSTTAEAWVDVSINGRNFQDLPFVGKVYLNGIEQGEYILHWSDRKIVFRTNPVMTKSGDICVTTLTKGESNCLPFEYNFGKEKQVK